MNDYRAVYIAAILLIVFFVSTALSREDKNVSAQIKAMKLSSPAFGENGLIPAKYTCDGQDINPPLLIENVPPETKSLALIVDDPDAPSGMWVHWVVWNIDPNTTAINENSVPAGASQGLNNFRKHDFGGPCPPSGSHRYFFKIYALDTTINAGRNAVKTDIEKAMKGHILSQAQIMGRYARR